MQPVNLHGVPFNVLESGLQFGGVITAYQHRQAWVRANPNIKPKPVYGLYTPSRPRIVIVPISVRNIRGGGTGLGIEFMEVFYEGNMADGTNHVTIHPFLITELELGLKDWCLVMADSAELETLTKRTHHADLCY